MTSGIFYVGDYAIKNSGKLPILMRSVTDTSHDPKYGSGLLSTFPRKRLYANNTMFWPKEAFKAFDKEIIENIEKVGFVKKLADKNMALFDTLFAFLKKHENTDWSALSNEELWNFLSEEIEQERYIINLWYTQYTFDDYFENKITDFIRSKIGSEDKSKVDEYLTVLTYPDVLCDPMKENLALAELALTSQGMSEQEILAKHRERLEAIKEAYGYIKLGLSHLEEGTSVEELATRVASMDKEQSEKIIAENNLEAKEKAREQALAELDPDEEMRETIKDATLANSLRNVRVDKYILTKYLLVPPLRELAKRAGRSYQEIVDWAWWEIKPFLSTGKKISEEEQARRKEKYVMFTDHDKNGIVSEPAKMAALIKEYHLDIKQQDELEGMIAYKGKATGTVRILHDGDQVSKVQPGDIIVAQYTTPDFVVAMQKAAAIVTDQGGITSHAAIVSRELHKPCIIGTANATRIFREGETVEVDAEQGVVRRVKK
jgi:phosphohistidine swiveling domain-containing protein